MTHMDSSYNGIQVRYFDGEGEHLSGLLELRKSRVPAGGTKFVMV